VAFVICMFVIAWAAASHSALLSNIALLVFLAGTGVLLSGLLFVAIEVRASAASVRYEALRVMDIGRKVD
jgi:hypothetical protein